MTLESIYFDANKPKQIVAKLICLYEKKDIQKTRSRNDIIMIKVPAQQFQYFYVMIELKLTFSSAIHELQEKGCVSFIVFLPLTKHMIFSGNVLTS